MLNHTPINPPLYAYALYVVVDFQLLVISSGHSPRPFNFCCFVDSNLFSLFLRCWARTHLPHFQVKHSSLYHTLASIFDNIKIHCKTDPTLFIIPESKSFCFLGFSRRLLFCLLNQNFNLFSFRELGCVEGRLA